MFQECLSEGEIAWKERKSFKVPFVRFLKFCRNGMKADFAFLQVAKKCTRAMFQRFSQTFWCRNLIPKFLRSYVKNIFFS